MKHKKTIASVLGSPWFITPSLVSGYLPTLSAFLSNKDVSNLWDNDTPIFSIIERPNNSAGSSSPNSRIGIINMTGVIFKDDQMCGPIGTKSMQAQMESWKRNNEADAVMFYTDSPGGQASGTRRFAQYVNNYPLPTAAYIDGVAGSAAYYIIAPTKRIFMEPDADVVGSIGAMTNYKSVKGALDKMGIEITEIYAKSSYDKNLADRKAKEGDFTLIEEGINPMALKFEADTLNYRNGSLKEEATHGKVYAPEDALKVGLIDELGSFDTAISYLEEQIKLNKNNSQSMDKSFPKLETALNMEAGFESTDAGVFLNEEQLETVENHMTQLEAAANNELDLRTAAETRATNLETAATEASTANTAIVDEVNANLGLAGDEAVTDVAGAFAALNSHIAVLGKQPGETHTKTKKKEDEDSKFDYLDFDSPLYQPNK